MKIPLESHGVEMVDQVDKLSSVHWPDLTFPPINLWSAPKMGKQQVESEVLYEKLIYENEIKNYQLRLVVNEFRGEQYVHIRKYFQSFEGEWIPSKEGVSMVASIQNIHALLEGLMELTSLEENTALVEEFFGSKISHLIRTGE